MNLRQLEILVAVIDHGGVSKAADHLHVSQPAVSASLRTLEDELGLRLFERPSGGRRSRPTERAMKLYDEARAILRQCELIKRAIIADDNEPSQLRVGVLHTLPAREVAKSLAALRQDHPQFHWRFREGSDGQLNRWLSEGRTDIAWTAISDSEMNARVLWREPYVAMVAKSHPIARSKRLAIRIKDLRGEPIVLRGACELPRKALAAAGVTFKRAARTERDDLALAMVAEGHGFAVAPRNLATADVVALAVSDLGLSRAIGLKWREGVAQEAVEAVASVVSVRER